MVNDMLEFETGSGNKYIYDDSTGMIFPAKVKDGFLESKSFWNSFVKKWEKEGAFKRETNNTLIEINEEKILEHLVKDGNGFKQLILIITDNCNLRCKYCVFSGNYQLHREYSSENMSFSIAKKAVDYYLNGFEVVHRRNPLRKPVVGFYGGEPLLNFELIKKVVKYISDSRYQPLYNVTTNGTLLSGEKLDFLIKNNFAISISIDGPKEEHDKNRIFSNGSGTFETVIKNIKNLKQKFPEYTKCGLVSVYDLKTNLINCKTFFDQKWLPSIIRADPVMTQGTKYYEQFTIEDVGKNKNQRDELRKQWLKEILPGNEVLGYGGIMFGVSYANLLLRPIGKIKRASIMPYTGACIPGDKIAVRPNGTFNMCERISDNFPIGDVHNGLDYKIIKDYIQNYLNNICENCENCPVSRLCSLCFSQCTAETNFEKQPQNICNIIKEDKKRELCELYTILETNPELYTKLSTDYYRDLISRFQLQEGLL